MRIDKKIDEYLISERSMNGLFQNILKKLLKKNPNEAKKQMRRSWKTLSNALKEKQLENDALKIINRNLKTHYTNLDQITKSDIEKISEDIIQEDFKHFFELLRSEAFPPLSFYPLLKVFLELDKIIAGKGDVSYKTMIVYGLMWLFLVSGKFISKWKEWKKEHPEEYEKEGSKKNPFAMKKGGK